MTDLPLVDARTLRPSPADRERLVRRARLLAWGGNAWHVIEFAIAVGAGVAAGSIALVGFGLDSLVEALPAPFCGSSGPAGAPSGPSAAPSS